MKHFLFAIIIFVISACFWITKAQAEQAEELNLEMQDGSGRPLSGVGWLCQIDTKKKLICISDFQYFLTDSSKFFTEDNRPAGVNNFELQKLVRFEANGRGEILTLRRYLDAEGEYSSKALPESSNNIPATSAGNKNIKRDKIIKENGVWKN